MGKSFTLIAALLAFAMSANAEEQTQTNTSNVKASDVVPAEKQSDIDEEITNARMRAQLGSKSAISIKTALGYNAGSLQKPISEVRPNYRAAKSPPAISSLSGNVGVNVRATDRDNISFGTGLTVRNPFHGDLNRSQFADPREGRTASVDRFEASTPYIGWSRGYKAGNMQMSSDVTYSHYTSPDATETMNALGDVSFSQSVLADFGTSGWSGGLSFALGLNIYKGELAPDAVAAGYAQSEFDYGLYPFAEYSFNDKYSFRTVFGYFEASKYKGSSGAVESNMPYQSMGIGMAITRDVYLYPNVQFRPLDIRAADTNVAMSANINVF